jgi:hypothetical protein
MGIKNRDTNIAIAILQQSTGALPAPPNGQPFAIEPLREKMEKERAQLIGTARAVPTSLKFLSEAEVIDQWFKPLPSLNLMTPQQFSAALRKDRNQMFKDLILATLIDKPAQSVNPLQKLFGRAGASPDRLQRLTTNQYAQYVDNLAPLYTKNYQNARQSEANTRKNLDLIRDGFLQTLRNAAVDAKLNEESTQKSLDTTVSTTLKSATNTLSISKQIAARSEQDAQSYIAWKKEVAQILKTNSEKLADIAANNSADENLVTTFLANVDRLPSDLIALAKNVAAISAQNDDPAYVTKMLLLRAVGEENFRKTINPSGG